MTVQPPICELLISTVRCRIVPHSVFSIVDAPKKTKSSLYIPNNFLSMHHAPASVRLGSGGFGGRISTFIAMLHTVAVLRPLPKFSNTEPSLIPRARARSALTAPICDCSNDGTKYMASCPLYSYWLGPCLESTTMNLPLDPISRAGTACLKRRYNCSFKTITEVFVMPYAWSYFFASASLRS